MNPSIETPVRGPRCPPPVTLEAISAGEAPPADVAAHVPSCASCSGYVAALTEARQAYLRSRPADQFLRKLERREAQAAKAPKRWWWSALGGVVAATAAAFIAVVAVGDGGRDPGVIVKGDPFRIVARRGEQAPFPVESSMRLQAGDALRFSYAAPEPGHLLVLDLDGSGRASVFHPFGGQASAPIAEGSSDFLAGSVELDDSPGPEWIVAVFSKKPLQAAPLLAQLRDQVGASEVKVRCEDCRVSAVRILKGP